MIRIGMIDLDSSHAPEFTRRINHVGIDEEQWVDGATVVAACPGYSPAVVDAEAKNEQYTQDLRDCGVEIVDSREAVFEMVDAVTISSDDGRRHYDAARMAIEAGLPTFIDKPMTCSLSEAVALADLAEERGVPLFSASSLRYAPEVVEVADGALGEVVAVDAISPSRSACEGVPGMFYYGMHGVEILYTLMGPGCESVQCMETKFGALATGTWADGRIGSSRGYVRGTAGFGFRAVGEDGHRALLAGTGVIYRELLKRVIAMFESGEAPIDIGETLEIIAFIEAAVESARTGERVEVSVR
jgi:predicted dehydrogenase